MNALVGERLSIVTAKAQTTRHRIMGIVNGEDYQIVYSDTPGILKPNYKLQESMMSFVRHCNFGCRCYPLCYRCGREKQKTWSIWRSLKIWTIPVLLVINKIDLTNQEELEKIYQMERLDSKCRDISYLSYRRNSTWILF
jgi:GTPase